MMKTVFVLCSALALLAAAFLAVGLLGSGGVLLAVGPSLKLWVELDEHRRLFDELDRADAAVRRHLEAKESLAGEVVARRRTLADAISRLRALDPPNPEYLGRLADRYPGTSEDERHGLNLIDTAAGRAAGPAERERLAARLEAELREHLAAQSLLQRSGPFP